MSKILREYWSYQETHLLKPYYLGQSIDLQSESENLKKSIEGEYDYEYIGQNKFLWILTIKDNIIIRIAYKKNFPIPNFKFWNNHYDLISAHLKLLCERVDETYTGDKMYVVSRDGFVTLIILTKGHEL